MLLVAVLALSVPIQQIPDKASVMYTGLPTSSAADAVRMVTHDARVTLTKTVGYLESLTYLKNESTQPASVTVSIPVKGHNVDWSMVDRLKVSASVDGAPVALTVHTPITIGTTESRKRASGIFADSYTKLFTFDLTFVPRQAHALRVWFSTTLGHAGLDGAQRVVAYDTSGGSTWKDQVDQINFSLKYTPQLVFQVFAALPQNRWEVGARGAFVKESNIRPSPDSKLVFTYYPGGYDKIGGG